MKGRDEIPVPCAILDHERAFLEGLTAILPEGARVVNIGALSGCSTIAMLRGGRDIADFHLYSIDVKSQPRELRYARDCGLANPGRFTQICGDSKVVGKKWLTEVHLVFIDGDHSYEGCKGDIESWEPHIAEGGYLVFHDYESYIDSVTETIDDWFREAKKRDWMKVAKVDLSVVFKRGGFAERLAMHGISDTIAAKFMRGEE
jgi:predicted O-methyltransferase YrrM